MSLNYDAVGSTFGMDVLFDYNNNDHRQLLMPGQFYRCELWDNGELLITGTITSHKFKDEAKQQWTQLGGYSITGILEDVNVPVQAYPIQFDKLSLREIATKLCSIFNITVVYDAIVATELDTVFETVKTEYEKTIKEWLAELASQRFIVMSHTPKGELLFTRADVTQAPIYDFKYPNSIATGMELSFNGQGMHSSTVVLSQIGIDPNCVSEDGAISNPYVPIFRPRVIQQSAETTIVAANNTPLNADDKTIKELTGEQITRASQMALATELKNIKLTIQLDTWYIDGKIIRPNNIVTVTNPNLFLFAKSKWFIESVTLNGNQKEQTSTLTCVIPEVFSAVSPENMFISNGNYKFY